MKKSILIIIPVLIISCVTKSFCQEFIQTHSEKYLYTKQGKAILDKQHLILECLHNLNKDRTDATALSICKCQIDKIDWHFTNKQVSDNTIGRVINIDNLIKSDSSLEKEMNACFTNSGKSILLHAEGFEKEFIDSCIFYLRKNSSKTLNANKLEKFCKCQLDLIKDKKLTDVEIQSFNNPNSILFYEVMYKCGNPSSNDEPISWNKNNSEEIAGPVCDTINVLSIDGMSYIKAKLGNMVLVWLLDSGASDLLITTEMESLLKKEQIITDENAKGIGEFEMANGEVDTCRKYVINNFKIGQYSINNLMVAVSDKAKKIIIGKSLLNKFSNWMIDNKNETLILNK
jgi:hypothetical protein